MMMMLADKCSVLSLLSSARLKSSFIMYFAHYPSSIICIYLLSFLPKIYATVVSNAVMSGRAVSLLQTLSTTFSLYLSFPPSILNINYLFLIHNMFRPVSFFIQDCIQTCFLQSTLTLHYSIYQGIPFSPFFSTLIFKRLNLIPISPFHCICLAQ